MYHRLFFADRTPAMRPDLRELGLLELDTLPVERGFVWRSAGPAGADDDETKQLTSGLVSSVAVGADAEHIVVGTRASGVWRSPDAGVTWVALGDRLPSLQTIAASMLERGPGVEPILFSGCGELHEEKLRNGGLSGVFRSVDGGKTWSVADGGMGATIFRAHDVNQIEVLDTDRVIVATRVGLFFSNDGGRNFGTDPLHRDGRPMLRGHVTQIVVDGADVGAVVSGEPAATTDPRPPDLATQIASPSQDHGLWVAQLSGVTLGAFSQARRSRALNPGLAPGNTALAKNGPFWLMSVAKAEVPQNTFAQFTAARKTFPHHSIHVTRRLPAAVGWGALANREGQPELTHYAHAVAVEPSAVPDAFDAWFGTIHLMRAHPRLTPNAAGKVEWGWAASGVMLSTTDLHVDQHAIKTATVPVAGTLRVFVGNDGGLFVRDGGGAFAARNTHVTALFWTVAMARTPTGLRLIAGVQDNGTYVGEGPADPATGPWSWRAFGAGDGGALAFVPRSRTQQATEDPNQAFTTANGWVLPTAGGNLGAWAQDADHRFPPSTDGSEVFICSETVVVARGATGDWNRIYFGNAKERNGPGLLHMLEVRAGELVLPRPISPPKIHRGPGSRFRAMVTALAAAPANSANETLAAPRAWDHVWIGLANGEVWFSPDAGKTLTQVNVGGGPFPVSGIAIDPQDTGRVAVVYAGFKETSGTRRSGHVFLRDPVAGTFSDISGDRSGVNGFVPDLPALGVKWARTDPPALVVALDGGVVMTSGPNFGARWTRLGVGLPKTAYSAIDILNPLPAVPPPPLANGLPQVVAASFGRGGWLLQQPAAAELFVEFDGGFGPMRVATSRQRRLVLHNVGNASLTIAAPPGPPAPFTYVGLAPGPIIIPPRDAREIFVQCTPTAAGIVADTLTIGAAAIPVSCEAFASGLPRLAIIPREVRFIDVPDGTTVTRQVLLVNQGLSDLHITGITPGSGNSTRMTRDSAVTPPATLAPGAQALVTLRFEAAGAGSTHEASWTFVTDDPIVDPGHFLIRAKGNVIAAGGPTPLPGPAGAGTPPWVAILMGGALEAVGTGLA